jgi:ATP synthase protein I
MTPSSDPPDEDKLAEAARRSAQRAKASVEHPEPSLGARLGQIGVLGWTIVVPTLLAVALGRWLDHMFTTGIFFSAPLIIIGVSLGFWSAWKWMHLP